MRKLGPIAAAAAAAALLGSGALIAGSPAAAHHSFAMFDFKNQVTMTGTVAEWRWTNPHAFMELDIPDGKGGTKRFTLECASPNVLTRLGWKHNTLKKGDTVTVVVNPLKNGKPGGLMERTTLPDGRTLIDGNPPGGTFSR